MVFIYWERPNGAVSDRSHYQRAALLERQISFPRPFGAFGQVSAFLNVRDTSDSVAMADRERMIPSQRVRTDSEDHG